jgi:hypothetical protein
VEVPRVPLGLLLPGPARLTPLLPTKLSARDPFPAPSSLAAVDLTLLLELDTDGTAEF